MTPTYYYDSKANKFYGPLDRMPPDKTLESIVDDIEAFSIYEPLWNAFHTYLSTLQPITHIFTGHSRVVPEGDIEWKYEITTTKGWKECREETYNILPDVQRRRVATPKITKGGRNDGHQYPYKTKRIHIPEYDASVTVSEDCPQEVIDALKEMCRLAYYGTKKTKP